METTIYVLVGKQVRRAEAVIRNGIARVQTSSGPVEFSKWHLSELAAKRAAGRARVERRVRALATTEN